MEKHISYRSLPGPVILAGSNKGCVNGRYRAGTYLRGQAPRIAGPLSSTCRVNAKPNLRMVSVSSDLLGPRSSRFWYRSGSIISGLAGRLHPGDNRKSPLALGRTGPEGAAFSGHVCSFISRRRHELTRIPGRSTAASHQSARGSEASAARSWTDQRGRLECFFCRRCDHTKDAGIPHLREYAGKWLYVAAGYPKATRTLWTTKRSSPVSACRRGAGTCRRPTEEARGVGFFMSKPNRVASTCRSYPYSLRHDITPPTTIIEMSQRRTVRRIAKGRKMNRASDFVAVVEAMVVPLPQAPAVFGLSRSAIYRAAAVGEITLMKMGRSTLVDAASVRRYLANLPRLHPKQAA